MIASAQRSASDSSSSCGTDALTMPIAAASSAL